MKIAQWKAKQIQDALRREDEEALRSLAGQGFVAYDPETFEWSVAPSVVDALEDAKEAIERTKRRARASARLRTEALRSCGLKRTPYGWE